LNRGDELLQSFAKVAAIAGAEDEHGALRPLLDACGWGTRDVGEPLLPSGVRHGVPFGVSFVIGEGAPEIRVFVEPQDDPPSLASYMNASRRVARLIALAPGADVSRLEPLFARGFARAWFAVAFRPGGPPQYRVYLCLAGERAERLRIVDDSLAELGVARRVHVGPTDQPTMLSIDLHADPRVKVYVLMPNHVLDDPFGRAMSAEPIGWLACHFLERVNAPRVAWHYGAARHSPDDDDLARRLVRFCRDVGSDTAIYERARAELRFRHHFVTWQRQDGRPRVTVYLVPEVRRP